MQPGNWDARSGDGGYRAAVLFNYHTPALHNTPKFGTYPALRNTPHFIHLSRIACMYAIRTSPLPVPTWETNSGLVQIKGYVSLGGGLKSANKVKYAVEITYIFAAINFRPTQFTTFLHYSTPAPARLLPRSIFPSLISPAQTGRERAVFG